MCQKLNGVNENRSFLSPHFFFYWIEQEFFFCSGDQSAQDTDYHDLLCNSIKSFLPEEK